MLIGAGTIGSRHLQGLAKSTRISDVTVVDHAPSARDRASVFWADTPESKNKNLQFSTLDEITIDNRPDFALVATLSAGRLLILEKLLDLGVKHILLEKVLFQSIAEYDRALNITKSKNARVYGNLPYRMVPAFIALKTCIEGKPISMSVTNGDRGLGCNGIHFFDLFDFLVGNRVNHLDISIDKPARISVRSEKFIDFSGRAQLSTKAGDQCNIHFKAGYDALPRIEIRWGNKFAIADYNNNSLESNEQNISQATFSMPMASNIAYQQFEEIMDNTTILPELSEAYSINCMMLVAYNRELELPFDKNTLCPIT